MSVQPSESTHHFHDELIVARLAGDDVEPAERADAERLVATCSECAALLAEVRAIMTDLAALPAPSRPRDFRLTESDAVRLRPRGLVDRLARFGPGRRTSPRTGFAGALGAAMAALGLAGILISGATTVFPQASSTVLYGVGNSVSGSGAESQAGQPMSAAAPAQSPASETIAPPLVGAATSPAAAPSASGIRGAPPSLAASAPAAGGGGYARATAGATAGPTSGAAAAGGPSADTSAAAGRDTAGTSNPNAALQSIPPSPAPAPPLVPIASLALLVGGIGILLLARLAARAP